MIATGFAGGADRHAHRRAARPRSRSSTTSCGSREESRTNTVGRSTRPRASRPRSTSAARTVTGPRSSCFRDKLLYLASGAEHLRLRRLAAARRAEPTIYAELIARAAPAWTCRRSLDAEGEPMRLGAARRARSSSRRTSLEAEELVGHEFTDAERPRRRGRPSSCELGADEAIVTPPDGCVARVVGDGRAAASTSARSSRASRSRRSAPATRSSPATSPRATPAARPTECLRLRRRLRRRVDAAPRRRHCSTRAASSGCSPRSTSSASKRLLTTDLTPLAERSPDRRRRPGAISTAWPLPPATLAEPSPTAPRGVVSSAHEPRSD